METIENSNIAKLSPREKEVATYIANGVSTNEIAKILGVKSNTVSTFRKKIFIKLNIATNVDIYKIFLKD
ncbi:MAG: Bacterial regulatory protein luxR family [Bacteroidota bacterium]|jgi:DNA-binding CsgD family transcriptional regulator